MSDVGEEDLKHKLSCAADLKPQVTLEPIAEEIRQCTYFRNLSEESIDVLNYFGVDAPSTLNLYSCALEDVFIAQLRKLRILEKQLAEIAADELDGTSDSINLSALQQKISIVQAQGLSKSSEAISDEIRQCVYFKHLSQDSIDVLDQFGLEAPAKLNEYTCGLEDILIELVQQLNHLENKTKEHLQSGATDISDYNLSLDDDIIAFSTACGPILRRAATAMIGVETYSTSDQEFFDKNYDRWTRAYLRLGGTTHGCSAINIAKYSAICYFALCGPAQISIDERLRYFNEFWNGLEFKLLGTDDPQELSDAVNDRLLAKTTNYNRCVSFKAANVLRTMFFDEWKGTKWLEDSEGRARFEKDFKYVAEQLVFLQENNVSTLHTAFIVSLSFSVSMSIHADECPTRDIYLWACKQLEYIQSTFNGQKAEGWSVDLGYDF